MNFSVVAIIVAAVVVGIGLGLYGFYNFAYQKGQKEGRQLERERYTNRMKWAWWQGLVRLYYEHYAYLACKAVNESGVMGGPDTQNWKTVLSDLKAIGYLDIPEVRDSIVYRHEKGLLRKKFPFVDLYWSEEGQILLVPRPWKVIYIGANGEELATQDKSCRFQAMRYWDANLLKESTVVVVRDPGGKAVARQEPDELGNWGRPID